MIKVYIDDIKIVLKNWGFLTYPIQKSFALRGLSHDASEEVMYKVRKLSLKINEKGLPVSIIKEINDVLIKVFSELPEAKERLEKDDKQIAELQEEEQFKPLINSLLELFDGYAEKFKKQPVVIYERALKMFSEAETILGKLEAAKASQAILDEQHERLAKFAFAIANILARGFQWSSCQVIAERAMKHARTEDVKKNLRDMVAIAKEQNRRYGSVEPITELPTLFSFFIGTGLYGHADVDRVSQSYVVTLCIHVLGIPLIPIRRYRVQDTENGFHFLGTYRLADWQKTYLIWVVAAVALYIWLKD